MATFVRHTACPICGSSDALAHYADGSTFCFSHGKPVGNPDRPGFVIKDEEEDGFTLPDDLDNSSFPLEVFQWLEPTQLTIGELIANAYFFSKSTGRLFRTFPRREHTDVRQHVGGGPGSAEDRRIYGGTKGPKTRFYGSKEDTFCYQGNPGLQLRDSLTIVEDSLSAIKVGRSHCSHPLWGSSVSNNKLSRLVAPDGKPFKHVYVWLDSDKLRAAHAIADRIAMLGIKSSVIVTDLDPKYLNPVEFIK